jgi:hypothetical protein
MSVSYGLLGLGQGLSRTGICVSGETWNYTYSSEKDQ